MRVQPIPTAVARPTDTSASSAFPVLSLSARVSRLPVMARPQYEGLFAGAAADCTSRSLRQQQQQEHQQVCFERQKSSTGYPAASAAPTRVYGHGAPEGSRVQRGLQANSVPSATLGGVQSEGFAGASARRESSVYLMRPLPPTDGPMGLVLFFRLLDARASV